MKLYVLGTIKYVGGSRRSWQKPTQQQAIYEVIEKAGPAGVSAADIVAALASTQFDKGVGCSAKNAAFYLNKMKKLGYVAERGTAGAVAPTMRADDAAFAALAGLEAALVAKAREKGIDDALRAAFDKYQKMKAVALAVPADGSSAGQIEAQRNQAKVGLRMALIEMVKIVY